MKPAPIELNTDQIHIPAPFEQSRGLSRNQVIYGLLAVLVIVVGGLIGVNLP